MITSESELVETLKNENPEFKKLVEEHDNLKKKTKELDAIKFLTPDQEAEVTRLKKTKLKSKDKMYKMLEEYRKKNP